ncbi:hypothetical protein KOF26_04790 [Sphingomonas sp. XMGL2]|uniref:EpsG family protein n=1 Tax=Sphingomonas quercus TaxID=2842451 RepID=A0ABS6BFV8_9SPHN|nr:hypothetical protein [Sphingomonas quercus]
MLALLAADIVLVSCRRLLPGQADGPIADAYQMDILWPSYLDNGFIRRGASGTVMALIRDSALIDPAAGYHILGTLLLLAPLILLLRRLANRHESGWLWFAALLALSPQLFAAWALDLARSDMLAMSFVAWAALAMVDGRQRIAVASLLAGSLVHEVALFYGGALLAAFAWADARTGRLPARAAVTPLALLVSGIVVIAGAQSAFGDDGPAIARTILRHDPVTGMHAAYMSAGGLRTLVTSACMSFSDVQTGIFISSCVVVLACYMYLLLPAGRDELALLAFVSFVPMVALGAVAIDYGRWLTLAVMNGWLAAVILRLRAPKAGVATAPRLPLAVALLTALVSMGEARIYFANDAAMILANAVYPYPVPRKHFEACDPSWRSVIAPPDGRNLEGSSSS